MIRNSLLVVAVLAALSAGTAFAAPQSSGDPTPPPARLDKNGDGFIDRSEAAASPWLAERFDELDKNKDGKLSADERPQPGKRGDRGLRGPHGSQGPRDGGPMQRLDTDKDGRISRAEAAKDPKFAERFAEMDVNKDGYVDRADFEARAKQRSDEMFTAADTDKDGKLSRAEFDAMHAKRMQEFDSRGPGKQAPPPAPVK